MIQECTFNSTPIRETRPATAVPPARLTMSISPEVRRIRNLRHASRAFLVEWGLDTVADTVELLITEIAGNAIQHTDSAGIDVSLSSCGGVVHLEVDAGAPGRPRVRRPGPDEEGGRGMMLVDALADEWGTSDDGSSLWCTVACGTTVHW